MFDPLYFWASNRLHFINFYYFEMGKNYTVSQKKGATLSMAITLSIFGQFAKFFHCCKEQ